MDAIEVDPTGMPTLCATTILPANAILQFGDGIDPITLTHDAIYHAPCPTLVPRDADDLVAAASAFNESSLSSPDSANHRFSDFRDPFYATQFPMCYALGATTITAYMLVIMLFVTPRSFLDGGIVYLGRRGFTNSSSGNVSIGGRPWLQKVAALTVAISLTVATADTFRVAQEQYMWGIQNASLLQKEVMGSVGLKVIRLISDTFLWLAQAQTLIRLFPRQREKIIIKWVAFALILLDVIFSALNSFQYSKDGVTGNSRPNSFVLPIPALSYLFQLSLGILYAAWVIYYAVTHKRYAFWHPLMKNISLVAAMSVTSVVIPVVFFILDISKPEFTGWGDYVRWVGAAAASVVVWEWVERIEALEREEKKDGILGREVFDGDETLEITASESQWQRHSKNKKGPGVDGDNNGQQRFTTAGFLPGMSVITNRYLGQGNGTAEDGRHQRATAMVGGILGPPMWPIPPPPPIDTPVSRTDTASATSTVYHVRYLPVSEATSRTPELLAQQSQVDLSRQVSVPQSSHTNEDACSSIQAPGSVVQSGQIMVPVPRTSGSVDLEANNSTSQVGWRTLTPAGFGEPSQNNGAPAEVQAVQSDQQHIYSSHTTRDGSRRWDLRARLEEFAANQAEKIRERIRPTTDTSNLPVTVIPAPARRGAALQQVLEEEELNSADALPRAQRIRQSIGSASMDTSMEMCQLNVNQSAFSGQDGLPPPLWPGVGRRPAFDDYESLYDDSISDASSVSPRQQGSEDRAGPSRPM